MGARSQAAAGIVAAGLLGLGGFTAMGLLSSGASTNIRGFPTTADTGVPDGTSLTAYSGSCTITAAGTLIDAKTVDNCASGLTINASGVVIRNSQVNTRITTGGNSAYSLTVEDSEVAAGTTANPAVGSTNLSLRRNEIRGGTVGVSCTVNCALHDNLIHAQEIPGSGTNDLAGVLATGVAFSAIRNTITCDAIGGAFGICAAAILLDDVSNAVIDANLIGANSDQDYCLVGTGVIADTVFRNNVFERGGDSCGAEWAIGGFDPEADGNTWTNNIWDDDRQAVDTEPPIDPGGEWPPTPENVGVPDGVTLTAYSGPCTITADDTVITEKLVICDPLEIQAENVQVVRSHVQGGISVGDHGTDPDNNDPIMVYVYDSELEATGDFRPIGVSHYYVEGSYLWGGHSSGECHNRCSIVGSYLHGFGEHASGLRVLRNGLIQDNTIWCEPNPDSDEDENGIPDPDGGCSADMVMYEEFGTPGNNVIDHNFFRATWAYYCIRQDGGSGDGNQVFTDNVMERGPIYNSCSQSAVFDGFEPGSATFSGNEYDDGTPINP